MEQYVGIKLVEAEPCKALKQSGVYGIGSPGYRVVYPGGYVSWCPKEEFEKHNQRYDTYGEGVAELINLMEDTLNISIVAECPCGKVFKVGTDL